jgi:hypothetical protein
MDFAILRGPSTPAPPAIIFACAPWLYDQFLRWRTRVFVMQRVRSLLRTTPSRISRRIARLVAIAAASLPQAGA